MSNYYEILGLGTGAGSLEIKAAFRRLAKLYHPDKNPGGKEQFTRILKAYEILSDPVLKSSYDYKLSYQQTYTENEAARDRNTKTWRFDEKEMKRRQYYNEHIKKYARATAGYEEEIFEKKTHNEYKYVLFATPIAVVLFLLLMKLATPSPASYPPLPASAVSGPSLASNGIHTGDNPFSSFFGNTKTPPPNHQNLKVSNQSGSDLVLCIFENKLFLTCCFIGNTDVFSIQIPRGKDLDISYSSGKDFETQKVQAGLSIKGGFHQPDYYRLRQAMSLSGTDTLVISPGLNTGFEKITEKEFFKKQRS